MAFACSDKNKPIDQPIQKTPTTDTTAVSGKINGTTTNDEFSNGSVTNNADIMLKQSYNKKKKGIINVTVTNKILLTCEYTLVCPLAILCAS